MSAFLVLRLTGGAQNASPALSLGGIRSLITATGGLFGGVSHELSITGGVSYRAVDLVNWGDATAMNLRVQIDPQTVSPGTVLAVGFGGLESSARILDETWAPQGVTFVEPGPGNPLYLPPRIVCREGVRLWLRRTVSPWCPALDADTSRLLWEYR